MPRYLDIELDHPRRLRYDVNALDQLERVMDGAALVDILTAFERASVRALKLALWVGLKHEDKNLTLERTGVLMQDWFDQGHALPDLRDLIRDAIYASGIARKDTEETPPDPPRAGGATTP